jgi:quinol monooxygenase YgiN
MADNQPPKPPAYLGNRISLHVKITVAPENVAAFLAALKPCWDAVVAEKECVFFEVFQKEPGEFCFIENWHASMEHLMTVRPGFVV